MRLAKVVAVFALMALLPAVPYAFKGYAGHDFLYHMTSWLGVREAWQAGQLFPTWSGRANFTLGDPRFCFYPPVSLALGGLLTLLLPELLSPAAFVWLCFLIAGLAMHFACRPFVAEQDRLRASVLYMLGPYFLMTSLVRFAAAELLVQAWLPLIFLWLYEAMWKRERAAILKLGCLLGLCWITDVPATIMLLYGLLPAAAICAREQRSARAVVDFLLAEALGGVLAAFYLAPVWVEQRWINMGGLLDDDPRLSLIFVRHPGTPQPNYVLGSWLFACAGAAMVAVCLWKRSDRLKDDSATRTWVYIAGAGLLFQLPISGLLWRYLPEMAAVQFPYRFLPLLGLSLPLVLFAKGTRTRLRWQVYALTAALSCFPFYAYFRAQSSPKMRTAPLALLERQWNNEGYMGKPEYVQPGVSRPTAASRLAAAAVAGRGAGSRCVIDLKESGLVTRTLTTDSQGSCEVRLATYYFPYWRAADESGAPLPVGRDSEGLLLVELPPGKHTAHVFFHPASTVRTASIAISVVGLILTAFGLYQSRPRNESTRAAASQEAA